MATQGLRPWPWPASGLWRPGWLSVASVARVAREPVAICQRRAGGTGETRPTDTAVATGGQNVT